MKKFLLLYLFCCVTLAANAKHITGGEMIYEYLRDIGSQKVYRITLRLFRDENCAAPCAAMPATVGIGIFDNTNNSLLGGYRTISLSRVEQVPVAPLPPCIVNPPVIQYTVGFYVFEVTLPNNSAGYTVTYQTCCRVDGISNVPNSTGATYTTNIPGASLVSVDSSPQFAISTSVMCFNKPFTLDFSATDSNGDSLFYSFCSALNGGEATDASFATPSPPPYGMAGYINGFSGIEPLGPRATINPQTGIISGIAPNAGKYVVSVCVQSYRNGVFISTQRKDLLVTVDACDFAGAELDPNYITCDGFSYSFSNLNSSPLNQTFFWDFGDPASPNNTSTLQSPSHTFSDTGIFTIKLVVNQGLPCSDSTTSIIKVYPGFMPKFRANAPTCVGAPLQFFDETFARYGVVNRWKWNFGDPSTLADTSRLRDPVYTYPAVGTYSVKLIVGSSKGCEGDTTIQVTIVDKAPFSVPHDTLICSIDTIMLVATSGNPGTITWSPNYNISDIHSFTPLISPDVTTTYYVSFSDNFGCRANDSVIVNVVDSVTFSLRPDTTICRTDPVTLPVISNALHYTWTPSTSLNDPTLGNPVAVPLSDITYSVLASIGKCKANGSIEVKVVPYPDARAFGDTTVCYETRAFLTATGGSIYHWSPPAFLNNQNIPNPTVINPTTDIDYVVAVRDTLGCPKPTFDTVKIRVLRIIADAGPRDTSVVINQPLQLFATGGNESAGYSWSPPTWLNNPSLQNPVSLPEDNIEYILEIRSTEGCLGRDSIRVRVFRTAPDIFVPTAFTPNGDGNNDDFKPIPVGMKSIDIFSVYNRWGQLLYSSVNTERGWDGTYLGNPQNAATYVWYAEGTDYTGKRIFKKGTVILIR